jgi:hypothetical protein
MGINVIWTKKLISGGVAINTVSQDTRGNTIPASGYFSGSGAERIAIVAHFKGGSTGGVVLVEASDFQPATLALSPANPHVIGTLTWAVDDSILETTLALESHMFYRVRISSAVTGGGSVDVTVTLYNQ